MSAPLSMGFSRQEYWTKLPFPSPGDLPNLGTKPGFESALYADPLPAATSQPPPPDFQLSHYRFLLVKF